MANTQTLMPASAINDHQHFKCSMA